MAGRRAYWTLRLAGMNNAEACRTMGRHPRQGLRWKHEQGGLVPPGTFRSGRYLDIDERCTIADRHRVGVSQRQIAAELGRAPSTISRELARNTSPRTGDYGPRRARSLGGRPDYRPGQPVGDRHPGGAQHPVRAARSLPDRYDGEAVRDGLVQTIGTLPEHLRRSLTWDQGSEMTRHHEVTIATGLPVSFCDPGAPWQRGANENTNGLLRQYFPKGTDLSVHSADHLRDVARELNGRPRKTLGWISPAAALDALLSTDTRMWCDDP